MQLHIGNTRKQVEAFTKKVHPRIENFFGVSAKIPNIRLVKSPKVFAKELTNTKRKNFQGRFLVECYESASAFYGSASNSIYFPIFVRSGETSFEIPDKLVISTQYLIHEIMHCFQAQHGGFSFSLLFDEGCAELCAFALAGNVEATNLQGYFEWSSYIFTMLKTLGMNASEILDWCKLYNISIGKDEIIKSVLREFIKAIGLRKHYDAVHKMLEEENQTKIAQIPVLNSIDLDEVQNELYGLFETNRII